MCESVLCGVTFFFEMLKMKKEKKAPSPRYTVEITDNSEPHATSKAMKTMGSATAGTIDIRST